MFRTGMILSLVLAAGAAMGAERSCTQTNDCGAEAGCPPRQFTMEDGRFQTPGGDETVWRAVDLDPYVGPEYARVQPEGIEVVIFHEDLYFWRRADPSCKASLRTLSVKCSLSRTLATGTCELGE
ncbi:hypothetical protein [Aestuariicoccus sp. MJ-SS9]|uniref:hypothetical protein n=1 Tax=Aestuariicoccus sp. MJ-SS9 TaxID=3079855 RepID=UPI002915493B|nr:hypothetical protein [Aestuariicoccus sp. MJ-SS9]MDU8912115.1 hypothetical protein [Aestuariicoccus sp. MJ-SS9]